MSRVVHHHPQYPDLYGQFKKSYHLEMVSDRVRTEAIFRSLRKTVTRDAVFCELGCGTGIFSIYAASRARKVYAVEIDPNMARVAAENFRRSRFASRIELIEGDALEVTLPERADVVLCEMMSIWAIEEPQIPVFNRAFEEILRPGGIFLPQRIVNLAELGCYDFRFADVELRAAIPIFTGVLQPSIITECKVARTLDFSAEVERDLGAEVDFVSLADSLVNCVRLSSSVQMGPDVVFSGTDTLMPQTVVPVVEDRKVAYGEKVRLRCIARARTDMGDASFHLETPS